MGKCTSNFIDKVKIIFWNLNSTTLMHFNHFKTFSSEHHKKFQSLQQNCIWKQLMVILFSILKFQIIPNQTIPLNFLIKSSMPFAITPCIFFKLKSNENETYKFAQNHKPMFFSHQYWQSLWRFVDWYWWQYYCKDMLWKP
jgi:hypothetical protein